MSVPIKYHKIGCCVIGLGHWGPNILNAIEESSGGEVVCAVEMNAVRRNEIAQRFPNIQLYTDFDSSLASSDFRAVFIVTSTESHYALAKAALLAGKHVFVEKPLARTSAQALELTKLSESLQLILFVGHIFLYNQGIRALKKIIDDGVLGRIRYMRSVRVNFGPIRDDVDAVWDLLPHDIAISNYLFNDIPERVACITVPVLGRKHGDLGQVVLQYPDNKNSFFFCSWIDPEKHRELTVVGDRKMAVFNDLEPHAPLMVHDKSVSTGEQLYYDSFETFHALLKIGEVSRVDVTTGKPLLEECKAFFESIRHARIPLSDGYFSTTVVQILEALSESSQKNGQFVSVTEYR